MRHAGLAAGAAVGAFALAPSVAQAANFEVNTRADSTPDPSPGACTTDPNGCTLREAVNDANANIGPDAITFQSGLSGTITLDGTLGQLSLTDVNGVSIDGGGAITVSGDSDSSGTPTAGDTRIFNVTGKATLSNLTLSGGYPASNGNGGAISVSSNAVATIDGDTITGNTANEGGGIYSSGTVEATNTRISNNTAAVSGGGISDTGKYSPLHLANSTISSNTAPTGGGIDTSASSGPAQGAARSDILNTTISGNHADNLGAGMFVGELNTGDRFVISHSTISGNDAGSGSFGGGIDFSGTLYGDLSVIDSTIAGNSAATGAGVSAGDVYGNRVVGTIGSLEFANSTIASNTATTTGGGIFLGSYTISPSTTYVSPTLPLDSTIVSGNTALGSPQDLKRASNSTAGAFDLSFSLVKSPAGAPLTQTPSGSAILGADPQLSALANNGGPTQTMLIAPTSPAVDKGFAPARLETDQRGQPRTVDVSVPNARDGTDIGAVEIAQGPPSPAPPPQKAKCKKHKKKHKRSAESSKKKCKKKKKRR